MIARQNIQEFVEKVVDQFHPDRVVLFGSYAHGHPGDDSDVDLLVVMPHDGPAAVQAARIRQAVRASFPLDLIVRSPETIRQRLAMGDFFVEDILAQGRILYETDHTRVG